MRTTESMPVPAASGTTMVTGFAGYCWARLPGADAASRKAAGAAATSIRVLTATSPLGVFAPLCALKRPCFHPFDVALEILVDKIVLDKALIGVGELACHRSPHLSLRADLYAIHFRHRT